MPKAKSSGLDYSIRSTAFRGKKAIRRRLILLLSPADRPELEHLSQSFSQLRQARLKFLECVKSINESGKEENEGKTSKWGTILNV